MSESRVVESIHNLCGMHAAPTNYQCAPIRRGKWSPSYGIVYEGLSNCVISSNVLHQGAIKQMLADLGGHGEGVVVKDNPGSLRQA